MDVSSTDTAGGFDFFECFYYWDFQWIFTRKFWLEYSGKCELSGNGVSQVVQLEGHIM